MKIKTPRRKDGFYSAWALGGVLLEAGADAEQKETEPDDADDDVQRREQSPLPFGWLNGVRSPHIAVHRPDEYRSGSGDEAPDDKNRKHGDQR